ncbi:MAG: NAD(P)-dependent oxidoreductase [Candidatus Dormibacteraeota bacterium]|nr:NAD(P)-dependent oxidoreductase [Candidatus Dormibacteraeota bacterium]
MEVGFIGLGKMGQPMVRRLLAAGHRVAVHNRSRPAVEELAAEKAVAADSARQVAARAELVLTALPTPEAVESVYGELAAAARPGQLFADHSTVSPDASRRCAELLAAKQAGFLDAPVSGGPDGAAAGTLTVMAGGSEFAFQRALPAFGAYGRNIRLCGPVGAGQAVKLVNQLLCGVHSAAAAEAAVFGARLGIDADLLLEMLGTSFGSSRMLTRNVPRFISRDFSGATSVKLLVKDLGLIAAEARGAGLTLQLGEVTERLFQAAAAAGLEDEDIASLVKLTETAAGTKVQARQHDGDGTAPVG